MPLNVDQWEYKKIETRKIQLDDQNPRIPPQHRNASILKYMLEKEGVLSLAKKIVDHKGLFKNEQIICLEMDGVFTVLEGNRRVAACKLLLEPRLVDDEFAQTIPKIDEQTRKNIESTAAQIAATRAVADEVIARIHIDCGKHEWSDRRQIQFVADRYNSGRDIHELSKELNKAPEEVFDLISRDKAFTHMAGLGWDRHEQDVIWDDHVDLKPFFRAVFSNEAQKHFGEPLFFRDGKPNTLLDNFREILKLITRHSLIAQIEESDRRLTMKSPLKEYFEKTFPKKEKENLELDLGQTTLPATSGAPAVASAEGAQSNVGSGVRGTRYNFKPDIFFENLKCCREDDQRLMQLVGELRIVSRDLERMRLSACFLLRATLERSLHYHLEKIGLWSDASRKNKKPSLEDLMRFCRGRGAEVFDAEPLRKKVDAILSSGCINDLNFNVHNDGGNNTVERIKEIGGDFRPFFEFICLKAQY